MTQTCYILTQIIKEKCYLSEKRQKIFNSHLPPSRQLSPAGCHGDDFLVDLALLIVGESEIAKKYNKGFPLRYLTWELDAGPAIAGLIPQPYMLKALC